MDYQDEDRWLEGSQKSVMVVLDSQKERIELLSSPFILEETSKDGERDLYEKMVHRTTEGEPEKQKELGIKTVRSQSPIKFRERLASLFGGGGGRGGQNSVDEQLKAIADTEDELQLSSLKSVSSDHDHSTMKSNDTRGSSLITEQQTYYNTIRNQFITAPELDVEDQIPVGEVPPSRLFLSLYPEQADLFKKDKELVLEYIKNVDLLYSWNLWTDGSFVSLAQVPGSSNVTKIKDEEQPIARRSRIIKECSITDKIKLNEIILKYKQSFKQPREAFQLHIFKEGLEPNGKARELVNGGYIAIQSAGLHYLHWKNMLRLALDDKFYKEEELECFKLKNKICGISFIMKDHERLLTKIWIQGGGDSTSSNRQEIVDLCDLLADTYGAIPSLQQCIYSSRYVDNRQQIVHEVYN